MPYVLKKIEGGLSMINVDDLQKSFLLSWAKKLTTEIDEKMETTSNWNDVQAR